MRHCSSVHLPAAQVPHGVEVAERFDDWLKKGYGEDLRGGATGSGRSAEAALLDQHSLLFGVHAAADVLGGHRDGAFAYCQGTGEVAEAAIRIDERHFGAVDHDAG